jgi:precorrin-2/cobalt-factor-2 C20-methyltransferase
MSGVAYGIGVGPGDPELITLKGLRLLRACPVIAYPAPEEGESLARRIVAPHLRGNQTEIAIRMPLNLERFPAREVYDGAATELGTHLAAGRDVAVLCLGDPFFYGSFMYLFARLAARHAVTVVPGVTSVAAAAAVAGAPLVAGSETLAVIPASLPDAEIERRLAACDSAAIVKLGRHFARLRDLLSRLGLAARARYVEHATMADERRLPLADVAPESVPYFSLSLMRRGDIS